MSETAGLSPGTRQAMIIAHSADEPSAALKVLHQGGIRACDRARVEDLSSAGVQQALAEHAFAVVDLARCAANALEDAIGALTQRRFIRTTQFVVAIGKSQLDLVGALIAQPHMILLCEPSVQDWSIALDEALGHDGATLHDPERNNRFQRLQERVRDVTAELASITDELREADTVTHRGGAVADEVRAAIRARRTRDQAFPSGLFADPAWDMLLDLFLADLEKRQESISSVCIASAVPTTTALRWLGTLEKVGLIVRRPDAADRRRFLLSLSDKGLQAMSHYVAAIRASGLPLA